MVSVVVHMIRTTSVVSAFLLATGSIAHAEGSEPSFPGPGIEPYELKFQHQNFQRVDMDISPHEYEEIYSRNKRFVNKTLGSYSKNVLKIIGIPEQGGYLMGAALGLVINNRSQLDLNESKTLALEFEDMDKPERTLYFKVKLTW